MFLLIHNALNKIVADDILIFFYSIFFRKYTTACMKYQTISENNQEMPQSRSIALPMHQTKERWRTNKDAQWTATEEPT